MNAITFWRKKDLICILFQKEVKNRSSFLLTIFMVACSVTSCILLQKPLESPSSQTVIHKAVVTGEILSESDIDLGFENLTRSFQNIVTPFNKLNDVSYFELVQKFHSTFTKVSFKYLSFLHFFQCREQNLFLDLRKILIWRPYFIYLLDSKECPMASLFSLKIHPLLIILDTHEKVLMDMAYAYRPIRSCTSTR